MIHQRFVCLSKQQEYHTCACKYPDTARGRKLNSYSANLILIMKTMFLLFSGRISTYLIMNHIPLNLGASVRK
jgi:hypothetical protein